MSHSAALAYLDDPVFYADMIDSLTRNRCQVLAASPAGVLLQTEGAALIAGTDEAAIAAMLELIDTAHIDRVVVHDAAAIPVIERRLGFTGHAACWSAAYLGGPIAPLTLPGVRVETLGPAWAATVAANYHPDDLAYAVDRIEAGVMLGAFRGETLLGFIGQHDEGAMGLLEVLPQYRHQGIARVLLTHLAHDLMDRGRVPYDHIIVGNTASVALQRQLGFSISTRTLAWLSRGRDAWSDTDCTCPSS